MIAPSSRSVVMLLLLSYCVASASAQSATPGPMQRGPEAHAHHACPWLTEGSVARLLGGDVSAMATISDTGEGTCKFMRQQEPFYALEVTVSKTALPTCPPESSQLKGTGNQATICRISAVHGSTGELISGRVRDQYFTVTIEFAKQKGQSQSTEMREDLTEQIAEQVAGNLF